MSELPEHWGAYARLQMGQHGTRQHQDRDRRHTEVSGQALRVPLPRRVPVPLRSAPDARPPRSRRHPLGAKALRNTQNCARGRVIRHMCDERVVVDHRVLRKTREVLVLARCPSGDPGRDHLLAGRRPSRSWMRFDRLITLFSIHTYALSSGRPGRAAFYR